MIAVSSVLEKGGVGISIFNRSRSRTVNYIVSKLPTNMGLSALSVRGFVREETPNHGGCSAAHHRTSGPMVLSKLISGAAYNTPLTVVVRGAGAHSNSCKGVQALPHPNRSSCTTTMGCGDFGSVTNNKRFSNELATPLYFTKDIYVRVLGLGNVSVGTRVTTVNNVRSRGFSPIDVASRGVTKGRFPMVGSTTKSGVGTRVRGTELSTSSINKVVRYTMANMGTNFNRPVFRNVRGHLTTTIFKVPTMGNVRFNENFSSTLLHKDRGGSRFVMSSNTIQARAGGRNKVLNNVADNVPVIFHITVGPAPSVNGPRQDMGLRAVRRRRLLVGNERSPYVIPHTMPTIRTMATIAVLSVILWGVQGNGNGKWKCR